MDRSQVDALLTGAEILRGWTIEHLIGEGRFGRVYGVRRENPFGNVPEKAALKWVRIAPSDEEIERCPAQGMTIEDLEDIYRQKVETCTHEIQIMRSLQGETNIVSYQDYEVRPVSNGIGWDIFIRMEQLTPLLSYISTEGVSVEMIVDVGRSVASALSLCHHPRSGAPIIHGDVKLSNVYYAREHSFKLGDFGLSFLEGRGGESGGGTRGYLAPECVEGAEKTVYSDQYALGKLLGALWTFIGELPQTDDAVPEDAALNQLWQIIQTATAPDPELRFPDIDDMLRALNAVTGSDAGRVRPSTVGEYLHGPGRSGDTRTDLRQQEALQAAEDVLFDVDASEAQEERLEGDIAVPAPPPVSEKYNRWLREWGEHVQARKGKILFALLSATALLLLATGVFFLLRPAPAQVSERYQGATCSLYLYKTDYISAIAKVIQPSVSSVWQEAFASRDWTRQVSALSADNGDGYGYVLIVIPPGGATGLSLEGKKCQVELTVGKVSARVSERCESAVSMLTMHSGGAWLAFDLSPALQELRSERAIASGDAYRLICSLENEIIAIFDGTFA